MLTLRLSKTTEHRLENLARITGRNKYYYAILAIEIFLEHEEDYLMALNKAITKLYSSI